MYKGKPLSVTFQSILAGGDAAPGMFWPCKSISAVGPADVLGCQPLLQCPSLHSSGKYLPLEILPAGDFEPLYRTPMEVQAGMRNGYWWPSNHCRYLLKSFKLMAWLAAGELPLLPLSITGAVAMVHPGPDAGPSADGLVRGDEFFIFKYDKQSSGLAGLSFDEGGMSNCFALAYFAYVAFVIPMSILW